MDTTIAPSPVTAGLLDITSWERLPAALRRSLATLARECGPTGIPAITTCFVWGGVTKFYTARTKRAVNSGGAL